MKYLTILLLSLLLFSCTVIAPTSSVQQISSSGGIPWPTDGWSESTPEEQGLDPDVLEGLLLAVEDQDLPIHSLLVIRRGAIVLEKYYPPYNQDTPHVLYSITKSFLSTLIGIAIDRGDIPSLDKLALDYFPERTFENPDPRKDAITLRALLTMTSGLDWEETMPSFRAMYMSGDWDKFVWDLPMVADPGSEFAYCSGCSHILSAVLEEATGESTTRFAQTHLFTPLGIENPAWELDLGGTAAGGWGLELTPRDMAKLGYLYLRQGRWDDQQIVSLEWVSEAVKPQVSVSEGVAYGYHWWVFPEMDAYAAQGMEGQKVIVFPEHDLIVVATAGFPGDDPLLDLVIEYIIPALRD